MGELGPPQLESRIAGQAPGAVERLSIGRLLPRTVGLVVAVAPAKTCHLRAMRDRRQFLTPIEGIQRRTAASNHGLLHEMLHALTDAPEFGGPTHA
jgi:hypothetical protein